MIAFALRLTALLLVAAVASRLLNRRSAALRAALWTAVLASSLLLPLLPRPEIAVSRASLPMPLALSHRATPPTQITSLKNVIGPAGPSEGSYDPATFLVGLYLLGLMAALGALALALVRAFRLVRGARSCPETIRDIVRRIADERGLRRVPRVALAPEGTPPLVAGPFRPTILLPDSAVAWDDGRLERVLRHEMAHVERGDGLALLVGHLATVAYWCHPLVWWAARELRQECERAADDVALAHAKPSDYAEELLVWSLRPAAPSATLPMARRSGLSIRLRHVLDARADRRRVSPRLQSALALSAFALAGLLPNVRAEVEKTLVAPLIRAVQTPRGPVGPTAYRTPEGSTFRIFHLLTMGPDLVFRAWDPQGRPVTVKDPLERLYVKNQIVSSPGRTSRWVGVYFEVRDVDPDPFMQPLTDVRLWPDSPGGLSAALRSHGKTYRNLVMEPVPKSARVADADVTLATGRYRIVSKRKVGTGPNDPQATATPDKDAYRYTGRRYPLSWIRLPFPLEASVWDWSYRATLDNGREVGWSTMQTDPQGRAIVAFEVKPGRRVVSVEVGRRPMRRFVAKNLPLNPR